MCGSSRAATHGSSPVSLCGVLARMRRAKAAAVGWRSRRRIKMLQHVKEGRKCAKSLKEPTLTKRRLMQRSERAHPRPCAHLAKTDANAQKLIDAISIFKYLVTKLTDFLLSISRPPRNHRHAPRCHPQKFQTEPLPRRRERLTTPCTPRSAGEAEWGGVGYVAVRKRIMGHSGLGPPSVVRLKIVGNQNNNTIVQRH